MADWKDKLSGLVYSTNPEELEKQNSDDAQDSDDVQEGVDKAKQLVIVELDKKNRKGKAATIVSGFDSSDEEIKELEKLIKKECGVGGSSRGGEILIQGDFRQKVLTILHREGYAKAKIIGGK